MTQNFSICSKNFNTPLPPPGSTIVDLLPDEIILSILSRLKFSDVQCALLSCRRFRQLADDNMLRKLLFEKDFPERRSLSPFGWKRQYKCAVLAAANIRSHQCSRFTLSETGHRGRITCLETTFLEEEFFISGSSDGAVQIRRKRGKLTDTVQQFTPGGDGVFAVKGDYLFLKLDIGVKVMIKNDLELFNEIGLLYSELQVLLCDGVRELIAEEHFLLVKTDTTFNAYTYGDFREVLSYPNVHLIGCRKKTLFALSGSGELLVWKRDFKEPQVIPASAPARALPSRLFTGDEMVIGVTAHGAVTVWTEGEKGDYQETYFLEGIHAHPISASTFKSDYLIQGNTILEFLKLTRDDFRLFKCVYDLHRLSAIEYDGRYLVTGSVDHTTKIWQLDKTGFFQCLQTLRATPSAVTSVHRAEDQFIVGYENGKIEVWNFAPNLLLLA